MNPHEQFRITPDLLASKGQRFLNHLIDLVPQNAAIYGLAYGFYYFGEFTGNYALNDYWNEKSLLEDLIITYGIMFIYYFAMESYTKKTLGKYVTNTMVVMSNGEEMTNRDIVKRTLCRLIPFDGLSFLGTNGKGWHDSMSNTYVVNVKAYEEKRAMFMDLQLIGVAQES